MRRQEPFSYEQHQDAADLLARSRLDLARLEQDLDESYGAGAAADAEAAVFAIDRLRERLRAQLDRDFPRDPSQVGNIRLGSIYAPQWVDQQQQVQQKRR